MIDIEFKKAEEGKPNQMYLHIMYEGGDADTKHPEEFELKGITSENYTQDIFKQDCKGYWNLISY